MAVYSTGLPYVNSKRTHLAEPLEHCKGMVPELSLDVSHQKSPLLQGACHAKQSMQPLIEEVRESTGCTPGQACVRGQQETKVTGQR